MTATPDPTGVLLCGVTLTLGGSFSVSGDVPTFAGGTARVLITGITGLGGSRKAIENIHNSLPGNWADFLFSCIARLKAFRVNCVTDTNSAEWIADLTAPPAGCQILWPAEELYTGGGQIVFNGGVIDVDFGAADIEGRVEGSFTVQPKGKPYVKPGALPA